jgi:ribosome recycling factor
MSEETAMPLEKIYKESQDKMHKAVEAVDREFSTLRTGRASVALVDNIQVEAYGSKMPLKQVATISTPDARTILIQPFDKNQMHAIEKAIIAANIGLTPNNDGKAVRLNIPPLTEERRKDLVKLAKKMAEDGRVAVRNIRRHANDEIKKIQKNHEITEDDEQRAHQKLQELTDKYIAEVDALLERKTKEIMEV